MKNRKSLCQQSKNIQSLDPNVKLLSLNLWIKNNQPQGYWVAGVFEIIDAKAFLFGQGSYKLLEKFSLKKHLQLISNEETSYQCSDLIPGDKIAVKFNQDSDDEVMLITANRMQSSQDPFKLHNKIEQIKKWQNFIEQVKSFFLQKSFVHLSTPNLVLSTGMESSLSPFKTELNLINGHKDIYLPTSPEFHLKRALSDGMTEVFEITPCFRNEEVGFQHLPEFTMLEWYRAYSDLDSIVQDIKQLIIYLQPKLQVEFKKISIAQLFKQHLHVELTPLTTQKELFTLAQNNGVHCDKDDTWDDIFFLIFISFIEPKLGVEQIDIVYNYPPSQAALAKINEEGWADRFEMYWQGFEIANAFNELTCAQTQEDRFKKEQLLKKMKSHKCIPPIDQNFINSLKQGLPHSAGIAMGLERLFMALFNISDIRDLKYFNDLQVK